MTKRVVSLFLPSWSTDRLRRSMGTNAPSLDTPLVLIGQEGRRARCAGGRPSCAPRGAVGGYARNQGAGVDRRPHHDGCRPGSRRATRCEKLAIWMQRHYSPLVAAHYPDGMILDIDGRRSSVWRRSGHAQGNGAQAGGRWVWLPDRVAPTYGAAYAMSHCVANPDLCLGRWEGWRKRSTSCRYPLCACRAK